MFARVDGLILMLFLNVGLVVTLHAGTFVWDGGGADNNWSAAANWSTDIAPGTDGTAALSFSGATRTAAANDFAANTVFAGLSFLNDASSGKTSAFTLSGNPITLGGNVVSTTASSAITDTLSLPLLLNGMQTFTLNNNHHLTVSGVIGETGGSFGLIKGGGGNLTLTGANTYTGPTVLSGGLVYFNSITNVGDGASSFGAPATGESGTITNSARLSYTGGSTATDRSFFLTGGNQFDVSVSASTLTLNGNIKSANNSGFTFRGGGNFVINGVLDVGSAWLTRTDGGTLYLNCPTNPFTGSVQSSAGTISISNIANSGVACAIGKGNAIILGQHGWTTSGKFQFTGPYGGSCNRTISIETTPGTTAYGGLIENTVAGQTLLLSGNVAPGSSSSTNQPRLQLVGAGNGELSGVVSGSVRIEKNSGAGTWTLSGANTYTGATVVSAGTLLINGSTHTNSDVTVGASSALGGTGTVYGAVSVASGGLLVPGVGGIGTLRLANAGSAALTLNGCTISNDVSSTVGVSDLIAVSGTLVLNGVNTLALNLPAGGLPTGSYTLMTYAACGGSGTLVLDKAYSNAMITVGQTNVTLSLTGFGTVYWKGDADANAWNTTSDNWLPGAYANHEPVVFDDTGSTDPAVTITPDEVAPFYVTVSNNVNPYTIGGAAITGSCGLTKAGTSGLTLDGNNTYGGATFVNAGTLTLNGSLSNSSVSVANGAVFTENAGGIIAGEGAGFTCYGTATLSGTNTYGGLTTVGVNGTPNSVLTVNGNAALGDPSAGVTVNGGNAGTENRLVLGNGVTVTNETLTLAGSYRAGLHYALGNGSATWAGPIVLTSTQGSYIGCDTSGGTFFIGGSSGDTISGAVGVLSFRGSGNVIVNSRIGIGAVAVLRDDPGTLIVNSISNVWGDSNISQGTLKLGVSDALPLTTRLVLGKSGNVAAAAFDLNGKSQTIAGLFESHFLGSGSQKIFSSAPATLIVSNDAVNTFGTTNSTIEGVVSLVKAGTNTLTLTGTNTTTGCFIVSNGTLVVSATGTLGMGTNVTVAAGTLALQNSACIADTASVVIANGGGAKVCPDAGVNEKVNTLFFGGKQKRVGTYGATGSGAGIIDDVHFSGGGVLTVLRDNTGTVLKIL